MQADKASILSTLYNFLWYPALPFALLAAHPASMRDYRERMGHGDFPDTAGAPRIGVHAASVCEIEAIRPVANGLLEHYPGAVMAITAMTAAGRDTAQLRIPGATAWMLMNEFAHEKRGHGDLHHRALSADTHAQFERIAFGSRGAAVWIWA